MIRHISINVTGKVQGVYFRASTKEAADRLGIAGFVCNQNDGSVYAEAEGNDQQLAALLEWCHRGPSHAEVKNVAVKDGLLKNFSGFEIRHNRN